MHDNLPKVLPVSVLLFLLTASTHAVECGDRECGQPHPDAPKELAEFSFLIGQWNCHAKYLNPDWETYSEGDGTWMAYYMMDGYAIQDDFRGVFADNYIATTFRAYNVQEGRWNGYWLDGRSGQWSRPLLEHDVDQGLALRTSIKAPDPTGKPVDILLQFHFLDFQKDRFHWRQNASLDQGKTWIEDTMLIDCQRSKTGAKTTGRKTTGRASAIETEHSVSAWQGNPP